MTTERHLVLGGSGFLGRHLARALLQAGADVTLMSRGFPVRLGLPEAARRSGDLFSMTVDDLARLIDGHAVVHHLAWSTIPATADAEPEVDCRDNVGLMIRLLSALRATGGRMVFVSSGGAVYGRTDRRPVREDHALRPMGAYGAGKLAAEIYARAACTAYGLDIRIARPSNLYGAGQSPDRPQGALSRFAFNALAGRALEIWGDGEVVRDYVHVHDVADGLLRLSRIARADLGEDPTVNLGGGAGASLNMLAGLVEEEVGAPVEIVRKPAARRSFDVPFNVLDVDRAARLLGWRPALGLRSGIALMVDDLRRDPQALYSGERHGALFCGGESERR